MQSLDRDQLSALADAANAQLERTYIELEIAPIPHISVGMVRAVMDMAVAGLFGVPSESISPSTPATRAAVIEQTNWPPPTRQVPRPGGARTQRLSIDELRDLTLSEIRRLAGPEKSKVSAAKYDAGRDSRLPSAGACALRLKLKWTEVVRLALADPKTVLPSQDEEVAAASSTDNFRPGVGYRVD